MRKNLFLLTIASALLTLSSCKKVWDYVKDHPNGTTTNCRIESIFLDPVSSGNGYRDTVVFKYNDHGDPISITHSVKWINSDMYFGYDKKHRLISYTIGTEGWGPNMLHKYGYEANKIIDTFYSPGSTPLINDLFLDEFGRVIKTTFRTFEITTSASLYDFVYDKKGNRIVPFTEYTNKTNILQTNRVWMFIEQNYSINEPEKGNKIEYNKFGLPHKIETNPKYYTNFLYGGSKVIVNYSCK